MSNLALSIAPQLAGTRAAPLSNVYQFDNNIRLSDRRVISNDHQRYPVNNVKFNTKRVTFKVTRGQLAGNCMLKISVPAAAVEADAGNALGREKGYGFLFIDNFTMKYGSSQRFLMGGRANQQACMSELGTEEAREKVMNLAGTKRGVNDEVEAEVLYVPLVLPNSCWGAMGNKVPMDSNILSSDIEIQVDFADATSIYSNYNDFLANNGEYPADFNVELVTQTFQLVDSNDSIAASVSRFGSEQYNYNFIAHTVYDAQNIPSRTTKATPASITMNGFQSGSTLSLSLLLLRDPVAGDSYAEGVKNHLEYSAIQNLIVTMNGQRILTSEDQETRLFDYTRRMIEDQFPVDTIASGEISPWTNINLSQYCNACVDGPEILEYGVELDNKTLQFTMTTPTSDGNLPTSTYTLYVVQNIQSAVSTSRGVNEIVFSSPR